MVTKKRMETSVVKKAQLQAQGPDVALCPSGIEKGGGVGGVFGDVVHGGLESKGNDVELEPSRILIGLMLRKAVMEWRRCRKGGMEWQRCCVWFGSPGKTK